jgi:hypothetical protein
MFEENGRTHGPLSPTVWLSLLGFLSGAYLLALIVARLPDRWRLRLREFARAMAWPTLRTARLATTSGAVMVMVGAGVARVMLGWHYIWTPCHRPAYWSRSLICILELGLVDHPELITLVADTSAHRVLKLALEKIKDSPQTLVRDVRV